jgi:DNA-binding beta-propeller fold protein YncE
MGSELFVVRCPSEQHVEVYSAFTMSIDRRMQVPGLREATAMASCPSCVYVGDRVHTTIYRYDVASFRWTNWRLEKDNVPIGLSINKANNIVVTTYTKSSKLKEYNSTGSLVRVIHLASDIVRPWHAIQMPSGHFVVCHGNRETLNRVCVVNSDGRVIHSYGEKMTSGLLHEPSYLTIDKNGCILVCDSGNNRILVMNASLTVARGIAVSVEGGMQGPRVLCFDDSRGRLYVGEMTGCRVYNIL